MHVVAWQPASRIERRQLSGFQAGQSAFGRDPQRPGTVETQIADSPRQPVLLTVRRPDFSVDVDDIALQKPHPDAAARISSDGHRHRARPNAAQVVASATPDPG